jgi:hypothetical protein
MGAIGGQAKCFAPANDQARLAHQASDALFTDTNPICAQGTMQPRSPIQLAMDRVNDPQAMREQDIFA